MRRHVVQFTVLAFATALALVAAPADAAQAPPAKSWAHAEIKLVVERGLMAADVAAFRPDDVLTQGELAEVVAALTGTPSATPAKPALPVTMVGLNSALVRALGLKDAASSFAAAARAAGLRPPTRFGTEVAARLLGLRKNHPAARDDLERLPTDPATRAEAAYSIARVLRFSGFEAQSVLAAAATFALPTLTPWQKRVTQTAVGLVGYPYVWGGEFEAPQSPFGPQAQGGFDCSGFVWRVYKLEPYAGGETLAAALRGRTTFTMSAEVPRAKRVAAGSLVAGDLVFFGAKGPKSKPAEVDHMGIYLGNGWIVHSSSAGVALAPLAGWYRDRFAWGRRPLAEAGLETPQTLSSKR